MSVVKITLPDGAIKEFESSVSGVEIAASISSKLAKRALAIKVNDDRILDLNTILTEDCAVKIIMPDNEDKDALYVLRHSCAHVMAEAICELFPGTKLAYGPPVEDGFYYDLSTETPITDADFKKIEAKMQEIIRANKPFTRCDYTPEQGLKRTEGDKYKTDNAERAMARAKENGEDTVLSFYTTGETGEGWEDLCAGPHVPATGVLQGYQMMSIAGAYWHGDADSDQLTRVYGTCFADKKGLKKYLQFLEEAKKRDHRKIGKEMDLFHIEEHSPGMVFWHPKGASIYNALVGYIQDKLVTAGYQEVRTPELVEKSLWEKSGHWDKYSDMMFTSESENREFAVKPMNCPCHIQIFNQGLKSWRDLPLRMAEFGKCHRNELAGAMHGIMRVRGFTQDDAHIFCTEDQIAQEVADFCSLTKEIYADFGFTDILVKFSTRPEKRVGTDESWDKAEAALRSATALAGLETQENPGEGAFYGPKLEFVLKDCLGRDWQCGTIQVDFNLPERLDAEFVDTDNTKKHPVMLHRAILGSLERFIGILIENYVGDFPLWLHPEQVRVIPVGEKYMDYAVEVKDYLIQHGFKATVDTRNEKMGKKIRLAETEKAAYSIVVGENELENRSASLRQRKIGDKGVFELGALIDYLSERNIPGFSEEL